MGNRIPKSAKTLKVTNLIDNNMAKVGSVFIANKTDDGWKSEYNGKSWSLFIQHLRNENFCRIEVMR